VALDDVAGELVPETETTVFDDITKVKSKFSSLYYQNDRV
jgi:hypothetical protein